MPNKLLVVIGGPTGVGKTALAIELALRYQSVVISADSRQVYKELRIGVGRPTEQQLSLVPHFLIGHASIFQHYSAGHYLRDALAVLDQLFQHHDILFMTGGTGLYLKAIMQGLDEIPDVPETITQKWTAVWKQHGIEALVAALETTDPDYAGVVDKANPMRLIRALAVTEASGRPYSSFRLQTATRRPFDILPIVLELPRETLYARINQRVLDMIHHGWLDEARALLPYRHLKALQTVGYRELFDHLEGKRTWEETVALIQQSTRQYAKRQVTWWRHQGEWARLSPTDITGILQYITSSTMKL